MQKVNAYMKKNTKSLEEEYDKALENEAFKKLVSKLKIKREILINYTSTLEECSKEYNNCLNCPGLSSCKNKMMGFCYLPRIVDGTLNFSYRRCKYKKKQDKKDEYLENITLYNVPEDIKEASIKKIIKTDKKRFPVIIWLNDFMDKYKKDKRQKGLYLYGSFGSGKTYLISAMFNELAKEGYKSSIIFWPEFLRDLKGSFNYKDSFNKKLESVQKTPLLLIDDLGAESMSPWSRDEILCPILQYRMDKHLPTFITSNLDLKALEVHLEMTSKGDEIVKAGRIISRIKQLCEYQELISKNLRD